MKTVTHAAHLRHSGLVEFAEGRVSPAHESPERAATVLAAVRARAIGPVAESTAHGTAPLLRVHDAGYLAFLEGAWTEWVAEGREGPALAASWRGRGMDGPVPGCVDGRLGHYANDACCPVVAGTWDAARGAADAALTACDLLLSGEPSAFALCRPPGHHAHPSAMGGYCYLNNAAVAARALRDAGMARVAVLDVDYHHGDGTQAAFYKDGTVLTCSVHADPRVEYPYFCGHADETGSGAGEGANLNLPLPHGTGLDAWLEALAAALGRIEAFGAEAVVVALGVDTYAGDPISRFALAEGEFLRVGGALARLRRPAAFVMEGGYAVAALGENVADVLQGFLEG